MKTNLYIKRSDGNVALVEVNPDNYVDRDSYNEALDFYYGEGYSDSYEDAKNS